MGPEGRALHPGDTYAQTKDAFERAVEAAGELGADSEHVVRTRIYLGPASDWRDAVRAHHDVFEGVDPANTTLYVAGFIPEGALVEVEVDAWVPCAERHPRRRPRRLDHRGLPGYDPDPGARAPGTGRDERSQYEYWGGAGAAGVASGTAACSASAPTRSRRGSRPRARAPPRSSCRAGSTTSPRGAPVDRRGRDLRRDGSRPKAWGSASLADVLPWNNGPPRRGRRPAERARQRDWRVGGRAGAAVPRHARGPEPRGA